MLCPAFKFYTAFRCKNITNDSCIESSLFDYKISNLIWNTINTTKESYLFVKNTGISDKKRPKMGLFCSYMTKRDLKYLISLYLQGE